MTAPMSAGMARLISQIAEVAAIIPRSDWKSDKPWLSIYVPIMNRETEPLMPSSVMAIVGMMVMVK